MVSRRSTSTKHCVTTCDTASVGIVNLHAVTTRWRSSKSEENCPKPQLTKRRTKKMKSHQSLTRSRARCQVAKTDSNFDGVDVEFCGQTYRCKVTGKVGHHQRCETQINGKPFVFLALRHQFKSKVRPGRKKVIKHPNHH